MKPLVAISGKGGTGKTTISALLVRQLVAMGARPVLAVDADPNYCLAEFLGAQVSETMAALRDRTRSAEDPSGTTKIASLNLGLNELVSEGIGFGACPQDQVAAVCLILNFRHNINHCHRYNCARFGYVT